MPEIMQPLTVRLLQGRSGSTVLMGLLGTSSDVHFDRVYPFENQYLTTLLRLLAGAEDPAVVRYEPVFCTREQYHLALLRGSWVGFNVLTAEKLGRVPLYYAEKIDAPALDLARAGIPYTSIHLLRDPRDVVASIKSFDAKRGFYGFGRREGQSEEDYFAWLVNDMRAAWEEMKRERASGLAVHTVDYHDLVLAPERVAASLSAALGLALDPGVVEASRAQLGHHLTTSSAAASIGRYRTDLSPAELAVIESQLAEALAVCGH